MKLFAQAVLFLALLALTALALPHEAHSQGYIWSLVTVDSGDVGGYTSIVVDANGDPMISYVDDVSEVLRFAICNRSESANRNCDQVGDWSLTTVDDCDGRFARNQTSITVDSNGDPMIAYRCMPSPVELKFARCDRSDSTNGDCDQPSDWSKAIVDGDDSAAVYVSIAVDADGDPMISYLQYLPGRYLGFATCDISLTGCDASGEWTKVTVGPMGDGLSIAVAANGEDPMIAYGAGGISFATCDVSATGCNETGDWSTVLADSSDAYLPSIAVDGSGDPMIAYTGLSVGGGLLYFATCDLLGTACDETSDWSKMNVDNSGAGHSVGFPSIAVNTNGDPMISYHDYVEAQDDFNLKFTTCDMAATDCDEGLDWSPETVDEPGDVGRYSSIATDLAGNPVISYWDETNADLKLATASPPIAVGGIAELPDIAQGPASEAGAPANGSSPSAPPYIPLAGGAAALLTLAAGASYARRRWLG